MAKGSDIEAFDSRTQSPNQFHLYNCQFNFFNPHAPKRPVT
ncbi:hypothetical protein RESH_02474 [Rhodopirellula europaea SH398]|uniref:Uncharacterized protein n=1 Tax=Rhodopirellula europaea SH398 TaxID=1263868 RepID=M5SL46_9BACT|nr:hypothetical protein RESH_02474 [Rhodopirellula europaea SH398]